MISLHDPLTFRLIVEMSPNPTVDEWVAYVDRLYGPGDVLPADRLPRHGSMEWVGGGPSFVMCRPVYEIEVQDGLIPEMEPRALYDCGLHPEPESTLLIDAIFRFAGHLAKGERRTPSRVVADMAAQGYYNTRCGGMPTYLMSILKYLMEEIPGIDPDEPCCPGKDPTVYRNKKFPVKDPAYEGWYHLRDFYEVARFCPDLRRGAPEILKIAGDQISLGPVI